MNAPQQPVQPCIRRCDPSDLEALRAVAFETYDETFRPMNRPETIDAYLREAFHPDVLRRELENPGSAFYFLFLGDELAGYLKVNDAPSQSDLNDPLSLEIERIYVRRAHKGKGLGTALMRYALERAASAGKSFVWLGVWEKNLAAIRFYKGMGFRTSGRHSFRMGDELQSDFIMRMPVKGI